MNKQLTICSATCYWWLLRIRCSCLKLHTLWLLSIIMDRHHIRCSYEQIHKCFLKHFWKQILGQTCNPTTNSITLFWQMAKEVSNCDKSHTLIDLIPTILFLSVEVIWIISFWTRNMHIEGFLWEPSSFLYLSIKRANGAMTQIHRSGCSNGSSLRVWPWLPVSLIHSEAAWDAI